jgi:hypothetical protein
LLVPVTVPVMLVTTVWLSAAMQQPNAMSRKFALSSKANFFGSDPGLNRKNFCGITIFFGGLVFK